jgi:hypothetical protein
MLLLVWLPVWRSPRKPYLSPLLHLLRLLQPNVLDQGVVVLPIRMLLLLVRMMRRLPSMRLLLDRVFAAVLVVMG